MLLLFAIVLEIGDTQRVASLMMIADLSKMAREWSAGIGDSALGIGVNDAPELNSIRSNHKLIMLPVTAGTQEPQEPKTGAAPVDVQTDDGEVGLDCFFGGHLTLMELNRASELYSLRRKIICCS
jgi:hypothetical protein